MRIKTNPAVIGFMIRVVKDLPLTKEQEAVAQSIATPEQKAAPETEMDERRSWR